jgi:hypothetical protein
VFVSSYIKQVDYVDVTFRALYEDDEEKEFTTSVPNVERRNSRIILRQAFRNVARDIKAWILSVRDKPSVIGKQYVFDIDDLLNA